MSKDDEDDEEEEERRTRQEEAEEEEEEEKEEEEEATDINLTTLTWQVGKKSNTQAEYQTSTAHETNILWAHPKQPSPFIRLSDRFHQFHHITSTLLKAAPAPHHSPPS